MTRRFSLKWLFVAVAIVGLSCLALRNASYQTNGYLLALVLAALATSSVGALVQAGRARAFWIGFAVFGGLYLLVNGGPIESWASNAWLPDQQVTYWIYPWFSREFSLEARCRQAGSGRSLSFGRARRFGFLRIRVFAMRPVA